MSYAVRVSVECPECKGEGHVDDATCRVCRGHGFISSLQNAIYLARGGAAPVQARRYA